MEHRPAFRCYGIAVGSTALALLVTWVLRPLPPPLPGLFMLLTVLGSTMYGGLGPGLLATACAFLMLSTLVLPPTYVQIVPLTQGVRLGVFAVLACTGSVLLALGRRLTTQLQQVNAELEARVAERTATLTQAHTAFAASEARYRELFENANDIIYTHDLQGFFTSVNKAAEQLSGYTRAEALQMHIAQVVVPEQLALANQVTARQLAGETPPPYELQILTKAGRRVPLEVHTRLLMHEGHPVGIQGIARDITERKQAEEAVRHSEERYRTLADAAADVVFTLAGDGTLTSLNPAFLALTGWPVSAWLGKPFTPLLPRDEVPRALALFQRVLHGERIVREELRIVAAAGEQKTVEFTATPQLQQGQIVGVWGIAHDITARSQAEKRTAALLEVATHLSGTFVLEDILHRVQRLMTEVLPCDFVATFYWDPAREVFGLLSHHGIAPELLPDAKALAFPPDEPFGGQLTSGQPVVINDITTQSWLPVALLAHFHVAALVAVPLLVRGRELGTLVAGSTGRDQRFEGDQVELCQGIARQLAVGIEAIELYTQQQEEAEIAAVLARVGQEMIASLNTPLLLDRLCRLTAEALKGSYSGTLLWQPQEEAYRVVAGWGHDQERQETLHGLRLPQKGIADLVARLTEAEVVAIESAASPAVLPESLLQQFALETGLMLRLRRGQELVGFQLCGYRERREFSSRDWRIARGISQLASLALANARLLEELERANHIKEDFVGTMSHELRTPLHIILGYTQLLLEETFGPLSAKQTNTLERVDKNARELLELITATLDLSRLQNQQRLPLAVQAVRVAQLWAELESETHQLPRKPAVQVEWHLPPDLPILHTDPIKLKMVLKNLLSNALKFTEAGTVTLTAYRQGEGIEFRVRDTGIGIAPEQVTAIFEPFRQVGSSSPSRQGGVGLGLYIVRQLVEVLGGQITVESEEGRGSTFRVWLPTESPASPQVSSETVH